MTSPLISEPYRAEQAKLHETKTYGTASINYAPLVTQIIDKLEITHLLDYGAGSQMNLGKHIRPKGKLTYQAYDPCVSELSGEPVPAQLVCCIDVLEHIEPEYLDSVLDHLASLTEAVVFLTVCTVAAFKKLSDGRNAHLTQQPMSWWLPKIMERFEVQTVQATSDKTFHVIGHPKVRLEKPNGTKLVA
jgi:hypothetical protein